MNKPWTYGICCRDDHLSDDASFLNRLARAKPGMHGVTKSYLKNRDWNDRLSLVRESMQLCHFKRPGLTTAWRQQFWNSSETMTSQLAEKAGPQVAKIKAHSSFLDFLAHGLWGNIFGYTHIAHVFGEHGETEFLGRLGGLKQQPGWQHLWWNGLCVYIYINIYTYTHIRDIWYDVYDILIYNIYIYVYNDIHTA